MNMILFSQVTHVLLRVRDKNVVLEIRESLGLIINELQRLVCVQQCYGCEQDSRETESGRMGCGWRRIGGGRL